MPKKISKSLILERDGLRGAVPDRTHGIHDRTYNDYLHSLGPHTNQDFRMALASTPDVRFREFLERISLPKYKRVSFAAIAKACNIDLMEFQIWWGKASTARAIAIAQTRGVKITEDMARDALSIEVSCPRCDGLKFIAAPSGLPAGTAGYKQITMDGEPAWIRTCPDCDEGKVRKPGDTHARDKVLEMGGLIQRGGRTAVVVNNNFGGAGHDSAVRDLDNVMTVDIEAEG